MKQQKKLVNFGCLYVFIIVINACSDTKTNSSNASLQTNRAISTVKYINYEIINEYPHDPNAFTEGLEFYDGKLYESIGEYRTSDIRKVDLNTGKVLQSQKLDAAYFGEGLTILNNNIYQLTYRERKGFIYNITNLKQVATFNTTTNEAWGMTNNGRQLIYDDGSNLLHFIDPNTFAEIKTLKVHDDLGPVYEINELEMINGFIYANQWKTDFIYKIDTLSGAIVGKADLSNLRQTAGIPPVSGRRHSPDVLNGIAYDAKNNRIFITGKNWNKLFEIKLDN